jgi:hypothetical protein
MTSRSLRFGAAAFAAVAMVACAKPADKPVTDSTNPANATQTWPTVPSTDSTLKVDSTVATPTADSSAPQSDTAKPMPEPAKKP